MWKYLPVVLATMLFLLLPSKPNKIDFVLPDGFRGTFIIKEDNQNGVEFEKVNGRYVVRIPVGGVLEYRGYDPFASYLCTARFENGDRIWHTRRNDDKPAEGQVGLFGGYTHIHGDGNKNQLAEFGWFVGTEEEWKASHGKGER